MADDRDTVSLTQSQFLIGAALLEGGLVLGAFALGWLVDLHPTRNLSWDLRGLGYGLLAAGPMLLMLVAMLLMPGRMTQEIREFVRETLGPFLARCRVMDLLLLAVLAGLCEEILFRGLLFEYIQRYNTGLAILVTNAAFGLAHLITPVYAFLAAMAGLYLTALLMVTPVPNLLLPVTAHTVYDFGAFLIVAWDFRRSQQET